MLLVLVLSTLIGLAVTALLLNYLWRRDDDSNNTDEQRKHV
jgi:putative effector of murein hydrolase LrgA (UPF0299 family)